MKKTALILSLLLMPGFLFCQTEKKIVILHTNDLHSRLNGFAPESDYTPLTVNDDRTVGGFARISSVIGKEKENNNGITLVVDAGDFLMGTLFQHLEPATGFQLPLMRRMGYDIVALGNHEFDFGPEKLAGIIKNSLNRGEIPALLLGNALFAPDDPGDDQIEDLFRDEIIRRKMIVEKDGVRIGVFSIFGSEAVEDAPSAAPLRFGKQRSAAAKLVRELKGEGCDIIICLSHSGVRRNKKGEWAGEDVDLARKVGGIDVIISGHTHTLLDKPLEVNGAKIVQAGDNGRFLGRMEMSLKGNNLTLEDYRLIAIDDKIPGDARVQNLVEEQKEELSRRILQPLGYDYDRPVAESDFDLGVDEYGNVSESNLGPLVADAVRWYVNRHTEKGTDIGMVAVGVIRDPISKGNQAAPDIFRVMSLGSGNDDVPGYALSRIWITGRELKTVLEILLAASSSTPKYYCYYSGLKAVYNPSGGLLRKIQSIEVSRPDGTLKEVSFSKRDNELYSLAANSYMLEFIGIIKKMSLGLLNVVPRDADGKPLTDMKGAVIDMNEKVEGVQEGKEWLALVEYLASMPDTNGNGIPDIDARYSRAVKTFFLPGE